MLDSLSQTPHPEEPLPDSERARLREQLRLRFPAQSGWEHISSPNRVIARSGLSPGSDWEVLAARVEQGRLCCAIWRRYPDGRAVSSYIPASELGLSANNVPELIQELSRNNQTAAKAAAELRADRLPAEDLRAFGLAVRRGVQAWPDETLREAQVCADKALQLVETMFDEAAKMRALIGLGANESRLAPWKRDLLSGTLPEDVQQLVVHAREIYAELERRAEQRLRTLQARQRKLDAMLQGM